MAAAWTGSILAGGRARRLGGVDKGALLVGARSILERQVALLRGLTPYLQIVTNEPVRVPLTDVPVVVDRIGGAGALGGLYTALIEAPTEQVVVIGCDMPFLSAPFLAHLADRGRDVEAAVPRDAHGRHPLCASYDRRIAPRLEARIQAGDLRVGAALLDLAVQEMDPAELAPFDPDGVLFLNVNTPDDYARARAVAAARDSARGADPQSPTA